MDLTNAAGILFLAPDDRALFLKRSPTAPDYPRHWDFPGGAAQDDEKPLETALREAKEEVGRLPKGDRALLTRTITRTGGSPPQAALATLVPSPLAGAATTISDASGPLHKEIASWRPEIQAAYRQGFSNPNSEPTFKTQAEQAAFDRGAQDAITARMSAARQTAKDAAATVLPDVAAQPAAALSPPAIQAAAGTFTSSSANEVDYSTFLQRVDREFEPTLCPEHEGYAWAPVSSPPEPLHPGCRIALDRLSMDELGVARAIAAGQLTSPQKYENVWLFDTRITGTDTAYRNKLDEYCYRPPEIYCNQNFLDRCNGLTVIWKHPKKDTLDSKEFADRAIGSIFVPYISDGVRHPPNEVWGVAKVYDEDAAQWVMKNQMSTSPAVVFRPMLESLDTNKKIDLENGSTLLIEGKPSLLDHLAWCDAGVWDKGEAPTGVVAARADAIVKPPRSYRDAAKQRRIERLDREIMLLSIRMSNRAAARRARM